jgi:hypothetical protein
MKVSASMPPIVMPAIAPPPRLGFPATGAGFVDDSLFDDGVTLLLLPEIVVGLFELMGAA